jgi:hypothetical protein
MLKHRFLQVTDGGYFYRFYPKLSPANAYSADKSKSIQASLFNPPEVATAPNRFKELYGKFIDKYEEKDCLYILLKSEAEITFICHISNLVEKRELKSLIEIEVNKDFYGFNFIKNKKYALTPESIIEL